jgi:hypothetical protein
MLFGAAVTAGALVGLVLARAAARWGTVPGRSGGPAPADAWTLALGGGSAVALGAAFLLAMRPGTSSLAAGTPFLFALALALASVLAGLRAARAGVRDGRLWVGLVLGGAVFGILATFVLGDLLVA